MQLPGKGPLKKAFITAAASLSLAGCAVVPYDHHHVGVGVYIPPPAVYVEPGPVYVAPPVVVVPARPYYHHHRGWHR